MKENRAVRPCRHVSLSRPPRTAIIAALVALVLGSYSTRAARTAELLELPERPVDRALALFQREVDNLHRKALRSKKPWTESELRESVNRRHLDLEKRYARVKDPRARALALAQLALIYAELAWVERIQSLEKAVTELDPELGARLGHFEESEHFLVRVVGADVKWARAALQLGEAARTGYLERFGFSGISKVPGKKIRIVIHVDPDVKPRLYFNPSPPYHGEMRFLATDEKKLTLQGRQRIVYGFCHELGHMIAMWGEHSNIEDDKHAWAHYTGCHIVEEVYEKLGNEPWPTWTAFQRRASGLARLKKQIAGHTPSTESYESILALFQAIGDEFGVEIYGKAWNWLEENQRFRQKNRVPYLWLRDLRDALTAIVPAEKKSRVAELFGSP